MAFVVNGARLSFLQVVQWHRPTLTGWPLTSIRMAPQLQVAVRVLVNRFPFPRVGVPSGGGPFGATGYDFVGVAAHAISQ
jgi:hypothetical protein